MHTSAMLLCVLKFSHQTVCRNVSAAEIILILCLKLRQLICVELMCSVRLLYLPELRDGGRRSRAQVCQQRPRSRNPPKGLSSLNPTISLENDGFIFLCYIYIYGFTPFYTTIFPILLWLKSPQPEGWGCIGSSAPMAIALVPRCWKSQVWE